MYKINIPQKSRWSRQLSGDLGTAIDNIRIKGRFLYVSVEVSGEEFYRAYSIMLTPDSQGYYKLPMNPLPLTENQSYLLHGESDEIEIQYNLIKSNIDTTKDQSLPWTCLQYGGETEILSHEFRLRLHYRWDVVKMHYKIIDKDTGDVILPYILRYDITDPVPGKTPGSYNFNEIDTAYIEGYIDSQIIVPNMVIHLWAESVPCILPCFKDGQLLWNI